MSVNKHKNRPNSKPPAPTGAATPDGYTVLPRPDGSFGVGTSDTGTKASGVGGVPGAVQKNVGTDNKVPFASAGPGQAGNPDLTADGAQPAKWPEDVDHYNVMP